MIILGITFIILILAFIFSMLGLGGALLYVPVFKWFGYDFKTVAIPTALFLNGVTAVSAGISYLRAKMVDLRGAIPMIVTSFIGAPIGAYFTKFVPTDTLILFFSLGMVVAGSRMLFTASRPEPLEMLAFRKRAILTGTVSFFIGFIAGLLGIGGGFLFVPMMIAVGYPSKRAAATSAFIVIFSSFSGFAGHAAEGRFDLTLLVLTLVAVVVASQIGAKVMREKMKAKWIKQIFGLILIFVALKLSWRLLRG
jgi:uncharacterized membrane protein YfcA